MAFARVSSAQNTFLTTHIIDVEVDVTAGGVPLFSVVGLPDKAVEEARDRISAAIKNTGYESPKEKSEKVVVSLAPADIKKEGPKFDLAIALGYLLASGTESFSLAGKLFLGELSLDGKVRPIKGTLPLVAAAKEKGYKEVFVPAGNSAEAALIEGVTVFGVHSLREILNHLQQPMLEPVVRTGIVTDVLQSDVSLDDIVGQEEAKRALTIAAAGRHNVCFFGPPGTGKTMLAKSLIGILPPLSREEMIEVTGIHSVAGVLRGDYITRPPLRSPHHTSSYVSIVGGGAFPRPGEVTLAHRGVLFMDEFPEFDKKVIDTLREPLEERHVRVSRASGSVRFPADFILVAAMNPCSCGFLGSDIKPCTCSVQSREKYKKRISGPIVDRIDMWTAVSHVPHETIMQKRSGNSTAQAVMNAVLQARSVQAKRFAEKKLPYHYNSEVSAKHIESLDMTKDAQDTLVRIADKLLLSPRSFHRLMRIARTIADLEGSEKIEIPHIFEAVQYRPKIENLA